MFHVDIFRSITLSHAMRPGLIRHFWVANRAGPENDNKFKERVLKKQYREFWQIFMIKKTFEKYLTGVLSRYIFKLHTEGVSVHFF